MYLSKPTLPNLATMIYLLCVPEDLNNARGLCFFKPPIVGKKGQSGPPQLVASCNSILWDAGYSAVPFLRMDKIFEYIKEQVIRFQLLLVLIGMYVALYASQNVWVAYVVGAVILVVLTSIGIFGKTFTLHGDFSKPKNTEYSAQHLAGLLMMYTILFLTILIPVALYIQGEYDVKFFDKKTYHYYTSYE
jgi:hypothetical protein